MTPERWAQIEELFHRAADCEPAQRTGLLEEACRTDPDLRREVDALLSSDRTTRDHVQSAISDGLNAFAFSLAGEVVSHYRILDGLGGGGMGLVYRAADIRLGRLVALKFLPEESANNPMALARFEREARAVSAVDHPNICPIYEFGEHEGRVFLVMQLLEGQTLRELLENRRSEESKPGVGAAAQRNMTLPLDQVLDLGIQIADGLHAAHQKGIVHRDIKPANIFVTNEGNVKILDFGLAKLAEDVTISDNDMATNAEEGGERARNVDPVLSRTGVAIGTAAYMSPEQVRGEKLDARSDLFSFGLVLYEIATGHRAFVGDTGPVLHAAIVNQSPAPVRELNPKLPARLDRIINKTLEKDREARYQTIAETRTDIERLKRDLGARRFVRWAGISTILAVVIAAGIVLWITKQSTSPTAASVNLKLRQLTNNPIEVPVSSGAISPNGKYLAYTDVKGIHVQQVDTGESRFVPDPESVRGGSVEWEISPALWFPDSSRFLANAHLAAIGTNNWSSETTSIWEISLAGSKPRKIRDNAIAWSVSSDGSLISFGTKKGRLGEREIWLMDSAGEGARKLFDTDENSSVGALMWSPNQRWVIYDRTDKSGDTFLIRDLAGGAPLTLFPPAETKDIVDRNWLPDGRLIYAVREPQTIGDACNYWTVRLDGQTGLPLEQRKRATNWAGFCVDDTSVTYDGKRAVFREWMSHQTWIMADLEAGGTRLANSRPFTLDEGDIIGDWTSDSKTVLIVEDKGDHYGLSKEVLDLEQKETIVPSTGGGGVQAAAISPDEKWVIYQIWPSPKGPSDHPKIMRVRFSGGSPEMVFPVPDGSGFNCTKHPVNLCILIEPSSDRSVMVVSAFDPIKGTRGPELARFDVDPKIDVESRWPFCNISPDGKRLLISRGAEGPLQILPLRGGLRQTIPLKDLSDLRLVGWTSDGNALLVVSGTKNGTVMQHVDLHGNAQVLWRCRGGQQCDAAPSPNGRHVAIGDRKVSANMWMMENF